ncbi:MAG: hypothetical protein Q9168_001868 [Polycauliona sp. 1 TL-2023]
MDSDGLSARLSPYSEKQATLRYLTLPTVVDLHIPPSPPGSPAPGTSQKFERFAQLKSQGMHFNHKLAGSSALKNPMLLQKLMSTAGLAIADQYATTLPEDLWDPASFPAWAYQEALAKSQQDITGMRDDEKSMNHFPQAWGRPRDDIYGAYDPSFLQRNTPTAHTSSPIVTGTSVLAVKFKDGVVIAADNLASYGSLARFTDVKRLRTFNRRTVVGFGGDVSDMQYLDRLLLSLDIEENHGSSGHELNARNLHTYLAKVMYKRRSDINPLWNQLLVAGLDGDDEPFLSSVDLLGTTFSSPTLATGFGAHLAQPLLRKVVDDEAQVASVTEEQAINAVKECMKVLFYRDARSLDKYSIAVITKGAGVELKEDEKLENQSWAFADMIKGYGTQTV